MTASGGGGDPRTKVLFLVLQPEDRRADGGVESITQVIERLRGISPIVVTQVDGPATERWRRAGAEVHVWPLASSTDEPAPLRSWRRLREILGFNRKVRSLLKRSNTRVVHVNDIRSWWHAGLAALVTRAEIVFNVRGVKLPSDRYGWHWGIAARLSRRIVVLSAEMKQRLIQQLRASPLAPRKVAIDHVYSIVDRERFRPVERNERRALRGRLGLPVDGVVIGYVATFRELKQQLDLITGLGGRLWRSVPVATLCLVGDFHPETQEYDRECLEVVQRLGLQDVVQFVDYTPAVEDWYRAFDVTVVASEREGLARCMIESLACGVPVVSFDVCSAREILEGRECGFVVEQGDYAGMYARVDRLLKDPAERARMGENGVRAAEQLFEPRQILVQYEQLYSTLRERRRPWGIDPPRSPRA